MGGVACCIGREPDSSGEPSSLAFLGRDLLAQPAAVASGAAYGADLLEPDQRAASGEVAAEDGQRKLEEDGGKHEGRSRSLASASGSQGRKDSGSPPPTPERKVSRCSSPGRETSSEAEGSCLLVRGFSGPQRLNGCYALVPGALHHGRAVFRRPREQERGATKCRRLTGPAVIFFWDESEGMHHSGWCFGPHLGSKTVWAFNPGDAELPPVVGWRQPWFSEVLCSARVFPVVSPDDEAAPEEEQRAADLLEAEVGPPDVSDRLASAIAAFQAPQPLNFCVDCRRPIRSPCALPCGHLVCLEHVVQAPQPDECASAASYGQYKCPCTPECRTYLHHGGVARDGWGVASVAQQLLALAGPAAAEASADGLRSLKSSEFWEETAGEAVGGMEGARRGILACDTPLRLAAAYEWLGHEATLEGRCADAAVGFAAARKVYATFIGEVPAEGPEGECAATSGAESLSVGGCARRELVECAVRWQREAGAKAAAWAKRCGCRAQLAVATAELPAPAAEGLVADERGIMEALRPNRAAARQILDCPVCYRLLHEPTTTPCGHTFCRGCLARVLDSACGCPLCRGPLCGFVGFYAACRPLQRLVEELWPEETAAREAERSQELSDAHVGDEDHLALLVPGTLALPHQRFAFHVTQPQHRLLIRRAVESGRRRVGMCIRDGQVGAVGVELHIRWVRVAVDGRTAVECIGVRPFVISQSFTCDGYTVAEVELRAEEEEEEDSPEALAAREELLAGARELRRLSQLQVDPEALPPLTEAAAWDAVAWAVLAWLPAPPLRKYRCLELRPRAERLQGISALVREILASLAAASESAPAAAEAEGPSAPAEDPAQQDP